MIVVRIGAAVAVVAGLAVAGCSSSEQASSEQAAFNFADDDLCEWVSEDEVAEFVAAEFDWAGTAELHGQPLEADACEWTLSGDYAVDVGVRDVGQWRDFDGNPYEITVNGDPYTVPDRIEVVAYEGGTVEIGAFAIGHPAVSDGVVIHNGAFGQFAFGVPPDSEWLQVWVFPQDEGEWDEAYEAKFFAVADHFVHELGWLDER